jgi:hypothetical protein
MFKRSPGCSIEYGQECKLEALLRYISITNMEKEGGLYWYDGGDRCKQTHLRV